MRKSIKFQVIAALVVQFIVFVFIVSLTLYQLELRKHDYAILNLAGQLRVISKTLIAQSNHYLELAPRDYKSYQRDLGLYNKDLKTLVASYDRIINSFKQRQLAPDLWKSTVFVKQANATPSLLPVEETIYCTWDSRSRNQLDVTASVWDKFKKELTAELGNNKGEPRLEAAAQYIAFHESELLQSSTELAAAFRSMMEEKLWHITLWNRVAIIIFTVVMLLIVFILVNNVFRKLDKTVMAFKRVSQGDLLYQVPVNGENELSNIAESFNDMTQRLSSLFQLTDRINQATNLDDTLKFVFEEFSAFLPIKWVGLLRVSPDQNQFVLERQYTNCIISLHEKDYFQIKDSAFIEACNSNKPVTINNIEQQKDFSQDELLDGLHENNFAATILFPLAIRSREQSVLVFASKQVDDYQPEHLELLENIAAQVTHAFNKTIGMESLVVSAIEGLAKLAESRDPETGDHLTRMSLYSLIIAEQLAEHDDYAATITPAFVRDVYRFAPMHDIGKVGVPDRILLKPGKLEADERQQMQLHPVMGAEVLRRCEQQVKKSGHSIFAVGIEIAESHHEKFDGSGYPYQLTGQSIPLSARIVAAADVFDALTSRRPYKQAWTIERAINLLEAESGKHFDPDVVQALKNAMPRILDVYEEHKHV